MLEAQARRGAADASAGEVDLWFEHHDDVAVVEGHETLMERTVMARVSPATWSFVSATASLCAIIDAFTSSLARRHPATTHRALERIGWLRNGHVSLIYTLTELE